MFFRLYTNSTVRQNGRSAEWQSPPAGVEQGSCEGFVAQVKNNHEDTVPFLITSSAHQWLVLPEPATAGKYHVANKARSHSNANPNAYGSLQGELSSYWTHFSTVQVLLPLYLQYGSSYKTWFQVSHWLPSNLFSKWHPLNPKMPQLTSLLSLSPFN